MKKSKDNFITCVLDRFERQKAVLRFNFGKNDSQELVLAKRYLPKNCQEGSVLQLKFITNKQADENKKNLAYKILEEILKGNRHDSKKTRIKEKKFN